MRLSEEISRIKEMMYVISEEIHTAKIQVDPPFSENLENYIEIEFFVDDKSKGKMKCGDQQTFEVSFQKITAKLSCTTGYLSMSVNAGPLVWSRGGDTEVVSKLSSDSASKLLNYGVLINGKPPNQYRTSVTIERLKLDPTLDPIEITMRQQQSGDQGKSESGTKLNRNAPIDWYIRSGTYNMCVWNHPDAKPVKLKDKTTAFIIGEYVYYNNGRRHKNEKNPKTENYTCADVENSTKTTEDSTNQSLPDSKEVNMQYKDEKGIDTNYRYLKKGSDWFARNILKNGKVFNLSQKSKEEGNKYQSSIDNLEAADKKENGKRLEVDSTIT